MAEIKSEIVEAAEQQSNDIVSRAHALTINNPADLEVAAGLMQAGNRILSEIDGIFKEPTAAAYATHRSIKEKWNELADPVKAAITTIKNRVKLYHQKIEADARAARAAEETRLRKLEEERQLEAAIKAEEKGDTEKAEEIISAPVVPSRKPLITTPPPPKTSGIQKQTTYHAVVRNLNQFVAWCQETGNVRYLTPNQMLLDRLAREGKGTGPMPDGVERVEDITIKSVK